MSGSVTAFMFKSLPQCLAASSLVLWLTLVHAAAAQVPAPASTNPPPPAAQEVTDPLGRSTPRGTINEFARAAHDQDFVSAARYMQVTPNHRVNTETVARNLNELMDRYFHQPVSSISDTREGELDDGLPLERERVGPLRMPNKEVAIELVRVKDPAAGPIWLISSETLAQVPNLHRSMQKAWIERVMPDVLLRHTVFGISPAQFILWATSIAIPYLVLAFASLVALALARKIIADPALRRRLESWYAELRSPSIIVLTLGIHLASLFLLGLSLRFRILYATVVSVLLIVALLWLMRRLAALSFAYARGRMRRSDQTGARSLLLLGERVADVLILLLAVLLILNIVGFDTGTALAGLGIVGVALAVGAQKTVENFLGGVFLLSDKALSVGDLCSISNRLGFVEDVTLRSIRLRTLEQTLLSIPAGVLSQDSIENFSTRGKILAQTILRLSYGTSTEQLRSILEGIRRLLSEHPKIETESSRVRLTDFGERAIELEIFAYVLTSVFAEFLAVREELLLQIAEVVETSGASFARRELLATVQESASTHEARPVIASRSFHTPEDVVGNSSR
jgi:MscS family membrane protein